MYKLIICAGFLIIHMTFYCVFIVDFNAGLRSEVVKVIVLSSESSDLHCVTTEYFWSDGQTKAEFHFLVCRPLTGAHVQSPQRLYVVLT